MWNSSVGNAFENDPSLKDILASTYTSSRRSNYAVINGADKSVIPIAEELIKQTFNLFMIGNDENTLEHIKDELSDVLKEHELNLDIHYIVVKQDEWSNGDVLKVIETEINALDFP